MKFKLSSTAIIICLITLSCSKIDDMPSLDVGAKKQKMNFDIMVTRDGEVVPNNRVGLTKSSTESGDKIATMDEDIPFGLIGIDFENHHLVVDNAKVSSEGETGYSGWFDSFIWSDSNKISFSAYYPYVNNIGYADNLEQYSISYSTNETGAGPLVSKTAEMAVNQLNMIPLVFQHITNDIGYKICDVTPDPQIQGLVHLRKVVAHNVASAGVFVNDVINNTGRWQRQAYYRDVVVFEGNAPVGVGSANEKFIGFETLENRLADSHRYYSVPDDIEMGKQYVEVIYDVDGFTLGGYSYAPLQNQTAKFMLYGLLPDNVFVYGKQYTFHLGIDVSQLYKQISFTASVSDWQTAIYENNDDF